MEMSFICSNGTVLCSVAIKRLLKLPLQFLYPLQYAKNYMNSHLELRNMLDMV